MAVMPCSDGHTCPEESQSNSLEHKHSEDENDDCSPFCNCACCGVKINLQIGKRLLGTPYIFFIVINQFTYSFSFVQTVWHPPTYC